MAGWKNQLVRNHGAERLEADVLQRIAGSLQTEPCGVCEKMEDIGPSASEICEKKSQNEARKFGCRLSGSYLNLHIAFD